VIAEVLGAFLFDFLMAPAEWLSERVWRRHRKEPWWWRAISATVRSVVTVLIYLGVARDPDRGSARDLPAGVARRLGQACRARAGGAPGVSRAASLPR